MAFQYAVKFVCGDTDGGAVARGEYFTAINVHNPTEEQISIGKKFALAGEEAEQPGRVSDFFSAELGPDQVLEIDCKDIFGHTDDISGAAFRKGFVIIQSAVELDVVAVYTAADLSGEVRTIHLERVAPSGRQPVSPPELDHFKVYAVKDVAVDFQVRLTDQLDADPKEADLRALSYFANPTLKVHAGAQVDVKDTNRHLNWYTLTQQQEEPRRTIRYLNQFGHHSVDIKDPKFLLVPAQKTSDEESMFPESLDHYKCYRVIRVNTAPPPPVVTLDDQFGSEQNVQIGEPILFCLPVMKDREIMDADTHLAVYKIPFQEHELDIKVRDQFDEYALRVIGSEMLAVPTEKLAVVTHPD